jgi:hypothetical protein
MRASRPLTPELNPTNDRRLGYRRRASRATTQTWTITFQVVLRAGRVEQVGSPLNLYNNPANRFASRRPKLIFSCTLMWQVVKVGLKLPDTRYFNENGLRVR